MVSVTRLLDRRSQFWVNDWIMDSGAFSQLIRYGGFTISESDYAERINFFAKTGNLLAAVTRDWMCEEIILNKTGKTVAEHQKLTIKGFESLRPLVQVPILPVLQGYTPQDYVSHLDQYGELVEPRAWVGVGSVCKRNGNPDAIEDILIAIKAIRPDLRLHGFGLKLTALLRPTIRELLYSSDSQAWSYFKKGRLRHDPRAALRYAARIESLTEAPCLIQEQLFKWWHNENADLLEM